MNSSKQRFISNLVLIAMLINSIAIPGAHAQNRMSNFGLGTLFGGTSSSSFRSGGLYGSSSILCDDLLYSPDYDVISPESDPEILDAKIRLQIERGIMKYVYTYDPDGIAFALKLTQVKDTNKPDLAQFLSEMKYDHSLPVKEVLAIVHEQIASDFKDWLRSKLPPEPTPGSGGGFPEPTPIGAPSIDPILDDSNPNLGYTVSRWLNDEEKAKLNEIVKKYITRNPDIDEALSERAAIIRAELEDSKVTVGNDELEKLAHELGYSQFRDMSQDQQIISAFQVKRGKMNKFQRFFFKSRVVFSLFRALRMSDGRLMGFLTKKGKTYSLSDHKKFLLINRELDTLTSYWQMHEMLTILSQNENLKSLIDLFETPEVRPEVVLYMQGGMRVETLIQNIKDKIYYQSSDPSNTGSTLSVNTGGGLSDLFGSSASNSGGLGNDPGTSTGFDTGTQTLPTTSGGTTINIKIPGPGGADPKQFMLGRSAAGVNDIFFEALTRMLRATKRLRDLGGRGRNDSGRIAEVEKTYAAATARLDQLFEFYKQAKQKNANKKVIADIKDQLNHQRKVVDRLSRELANYYSDFVESFLLYKMFANVNSGVLTIFDEIENIHPIKFPSFVFVQNKDLIKQWNTVFDRAITGGGTDGLARSEISAFFKDFYQLTTRKFIRRIDDLMNNQIGVRYADTPAGQQLSYMISRSYTEMATLFAKMVWKVFSAPSRPITGKKGATGKQSTANNGAAAGDPNGTLPGGDFGLPDENTLQQQKDANTVNSAVRTGVARAVDTVFWTAVTAAVSGNAEAWTRAILHWVGLGGP